MADDAEIKTKRRMPNSQMLSTWLQVGASIAVVLSIGVLVFELGQQRELAQAQFIVDTTAMRMQSDIVVLGEDMGEVLARACFDPDTLTMADLTKLEKYFELRLAGVVTIWEAEVIGGAPRITWPTRLKRELLAMWRYGSGKVWWQENSHRWPPEIMSVAAQMETDGLFDSSQMCDEGKLFSR